MVQEPRDIPAWAAAVTGLDGGRPWAVIPGQHVQQQVSLLPATSTSLVAGLDHPIDF